MKASFRDDMVLELTSAEPEELIHCLTSRGIQFFDIQREDELTWVLRTSEKNAAFVKQVCEKQGATWKILKKSGPGQIIQAVCRRPVLIFGVAVLLFFWMYLPAKVLFIQVEGNLTVPDRRILYAAEECGISFGASRKVVRSEYAKNQLLSKLPDLEWVGVNTTGCTATISVRERSEEENLQKTAVQSNVVAAQDGTVVSITVTKGTPLCQIGQVVQKGDVLISGYSDLGIAVQISRAEGEVYGETERILNVYAPETALIRRDKAGEKRSYSVLLGKNRYNLWKSSGISPATCGRIYEEKYVTLPGGFRLPIALCVEKVIVYETEPGVREGTEHISEFADEYLRTQMNSGTVLDRQEEISSDEEQMVTFTYRCREIIGREVAAQIGDFYEQADGENG